MIRRICEETGTSPQVLAPVLGVSPYVVRYWRKKLGTSAARPNPQRDLALRLLRSGSSPAEVARAVGRAVGTVRSWGRAAKIGRRNRYTPEMGSRCAEMLRDNSARAAGQLLKLPPATVRLWAGRAARDLARGGQKPSPKGLHDDPAGGNPDKTSPHGS